MATASSPLVVACGKCVSWETSLHQFPLQVSCGQEWRKLGATSGLYPMKGRNKKKHVPSDLHTLLFHVILIEISK